MVNMVTTEELLSERVCLRDFQLVIKDTIVDLFDTWLVLMRFPVLLQVWRGPWPI